MKLLRLIVSLLIVLLLNQWLRFRRIYATSNCVKFFGCTDTEDISVQWGWTGIKDSLNYLCADGKQGENAGQNDPRFVVQGLIHRVTDQSTCAAAFTKFSNLFLRNCTFWLGYLNTLPKTATSAGVKNRFKIFVCRYC